jgi:ubiquinone/menaquinone biosynthesis C-methylase UbiE
MMGGGQRYWQRHAKNYDRSMALLGRPMGRVVDLTCEAVAGADRVLEVGAGTGLLTTTIARRVRGLVATDYAPAMIARLRERVQAARLANVECSVADVYALPYPPDSFDAVVAANVLHLVPDLTAALAALRFVLRPGGKLVVPTFCHDETFLARFTSRLISLTGFPGQRRLSSSSLRSAVEEAGLTVVRQETMPGLIPISFVAGHF